MKNHIRRFLSGVLFLSLALTTVLGTAYSAYASEPSDSTGAQTKLIEQGPGSYPQLLIDDWPEFTGTLYGEGCVLIDGRTGTVLYSSGGDQQLYPASITKIMTALLTLENCQMDEVVTFSSYAVNSLEYDSANIGLVPGEQLTVEQCLYALLLKSANEVATGLAEHIAGSEDAFAEMMNAKAASLGCTNTHFVNANGLHNDNHYTSAHDMALIMKALIHNDTFIAIDAAKKYTIDPTNLQTEPRYLSQMHKMLDETTDYYYEGTVAGKTGFSDQALNTLVTYAKRGDTELIAVTMGSNWHHYDDTIALFDYGFDNFTSYNMADLEAGSTSEEDLLTSAREIFDTSSVSLSLGTDSFVLLPNKVSVNDLNTTLTLNASSGTNILANVTYSYQGLVMGYGTVLLNDSSSDHFDFTALEESKEETKKDSSSDFVLEMPTSKGTIMINVWYLAAGAAAFILLIILLVVFRKRRKKSRKKKKSAAAKSASAKTSTSKAASSKEAIAARKRTTDSRSSHRTSRGSSDSRNYASGSSGHSASRASSRGSSSSRLESSTRSSSRSASLQPTKKRRPRS